MRIRHKHAHPFLDQGVGHNEEGPALDGGLWDTQAFMLGGELILWEEAEE